MSKNSLIGILALAVIMVAGGIWWFSGKSTPEPVNEQEMALTDIITKRPKVTEKKDSPFKRLLSASTDSGAKGTSGAGGRNDADDADDADDDSDEEDTPEEKAVKHWEQTIAVFYEETEDADDGNGDDKGGTSTPTPNAPPKEPRVTLDDQLRIRDAFREMTEENRLEEVQHAMNLLPDESVAVMYGVLFDKTQPEDIMDVIFSDILNRDELIKHPMLDIIRKDKDHPMYAEAARIWDVISDEE